MPGLSQGDFPPCFVALPHLHPSLNSGDPLLPYGSGSQAPHSSLRSRGALERKILLSTQTADSLQGIPHRNVGMSRTKIFKKRIGSVLADLHIKLKHYLSARGHPLTNFKYMFQFRGALKYFKEIAIKKAQLFSFGF